MGVSGSRYIVRSLGALALSGLLAVVLSIISPVDLTKAAAPDRWDASVSGPARVLDGDTLVIDGTRVRLEGIDAPESGQQCIRSDGAPWDCGADAARALAALTSGRQVHCQGSERDSYGRLIAVCRMGPLEINAEMVRLGLAWAFVRYSRRLVGAEYEARRRRLGIWEGDNEPAWEYRAKSWSQAQAQAPAGCAIKGNLSRHGRIYHLPGSAHYDAVQINPSHGERWFCSEAEALAAGWRPAVSY